jgi:hypothetical protein
MMRILTILAAVVALLAVPAPRADATPAGAAVASDQFDCFFYLFMQGYSGKLVDIGCASGAQGDEVICEGTLRIAGVPDAIAEEACRRAALA